MAKVIGLPKLSPTMEEGVLVRWAKQEGERVSVDDLLAEVETDKATMEFRSFDPGVLLKRLVDEGTALTPDQPVAILGKPGEDIALLLRELAANGGGALTFPAVTPLEAAPSSADSEQPRGAASTVHLALERPLASPLVRKLAREHAIELHALRGSGPKGRIVRRDLDAVLARGAAHATDVAAPSAKPVSVSDLGDRTPLTQMRKAIARRLSDAKREIPHFYLFADVDASALVSTRTALNADLAGDGVKLSLNDLVLFAAARALRDVPACNVTFHDDGIQHYEHVSLSVAVALEGGLVTPVIRRADALSLLALSRAVQELSARARDKKLRPEDLEGGTFSVSNLGMYGVDAFSAILNPPQACILSVGAVRDEPVVRGGQVVAGKRLTLGLSADHRAVDGAAAAELLRALRVRIEQPLRLML